PTPTGFASEDEAFAAAEATYRAYVDALNDVNLSDPETFEPVYALTTGDANAAARKSFSQMHADGWTVRGTSDIALVELVSFNDEDNETKLAICVDVSKVVVEDSDGSPLAEDRPPIQSLSALARPEPSTPT